VGTHVESPWHFYGSGKTCTDYPLEKFMGRAVAIAADAAFGWLPLPVASRDVSRLAAWAAPRGSTVVVLALKELR